MIFQEFLPKPELQPFIKSILLVHFEQIQVGFQIKPYPTRLEQSLNFFAKGYIKNENPNTGKSYRVASNAIFGQQLNRLDFHSIGNPEFLMLMVVFKAGAMFRLLGIPSQELTTAFCDAEDLLSAELKAVNDKIANAITYPEMIKHAEEYLINKVRNTKRDISNIDKIGELLIQKPNEFSLDWLADQACLSPRQFERKFSERMGVGPKLYSRIGRFYQAFQFKETNQFADWLTIALHFCYTDYNHLVKDFKQFGNVTPNILLDQQQKYDRFLPPNDFKLLSNLHNKFILNL